MSIISETQCSMVRRVNTRTLHYSAGRTCVKVCQVGQCNRVIGCSTLDACCIACCVSVHPYNPATGGSPGSMKQRTQRQSIKCVGHGRRSARVIEAENIQQCVPFECDFLWSSPGSVGLLEMRSLEGRPKLPELDHTKSSEKQCKTGGCFRS